MAYWQGWGCSDWLRVCVRVSSIRLVHNTVCADHFLEYMVSNRRLKLFYTFARQCVTTTAVNSLQTSGFLLARARIELSVNVPHVGRMTIYSGPSGTEARYSTRTLKAMEELIPRPSPSFSVTPISTRYSTGPLVRN